MRVRGQAIDSLRPWEGERGYRCRQRAQCRLPNENEIMRTWFRAIYKRVYFNQVLSSSRTLMENDASAAAKRISHALAMSMPRPSDSP